MKKPKPRKTLSMPATPKPNLIGKAKRYLEDVGIPAATPNDLIRDVAGTKTFAALQGSSRRERLQSFAKLYACVLSLGTSPSRVGVVTKRRKTAKANETNNRPTNTLVRALLGRHAVNQKTRNRQRVSISCYVRAIDYLRSEAVPPQDVVNLGLQAGQGIRAWADAAARKSKGLAGSTEVSGHTVNLPSLDLPSGPWRRVLLSGVVIRPGRVKIDGFIDAGMDIGGKSKSARQRLAKIRADVEAALGNGPTQDPPDW